MNDADIIKANLARFGYGNLFFLWPDAEGAEWETSHQSNPLAIVSHRAWI